MLQSTTTTNSGAEDKSSNEESTKRTNRQTKTPLKQTVEKKCWFTYNVIIFYLYDDRIHPDINYIKVLINSSYKHAMYSA